MLLFSREPFDLSLSQKLPLRTVGSKRAKLLSTKNASDADPSEVNDERIKRRMRKLMRQLKLESSELSVVLTDDKTIRKLNRTYRAKDKPTDVLAFALREGEFVQHAGNALGDVVVSLETAGRQAREHDCTLETEVTFLLIHGLLHLLGYDHQNDKDERRMNRKANALMGLFPSAVREVRGGPVVRKVRPTTAPRKSRAKKLATPAARMTQMRADSSKPAPRKNRH